MSSTSTWQTSCHISSSGRSKSGQMLRRFSARKGVFFSRKPQQGASRAAQIFDASPIARLEKRVQRNGCSPAARHLATAMSAMRRWAKPCTCKQPSCKLTEIPFFQGIMRCVLHEQCTRVYLEGCSRLKAKAPNPTQTSTSPPCPAHFLSPSWQLPSALWPSLAAPSVWRAALLPCAPERLGTPPAALACSSTIADSIRFDIV